MPTKQTCSLEYLGLEAPGALQPDTKLVGHVENISEEALAIIKAFDSVVFMNFARCSPVISAAQLAKECPLKSLHTYSRAAFICCGALLVCHRSLLSCYNEIVREQQ